jgi:Cupin-like domain
MLDLDAARFRDCFDREPFGFTHQLSDLPLFKPDYLRELTLRYADFPADYYVAASAASASQEFYAGPPLKWRPHEALEHLDTTACRILLKRVDTHDSQFRELLRALFDEVVKFRGGMRGERVVRLDSGVFITSAASTTPCHFDPEVNFFAQIEGEKHYHVYPPATVSEQEMERFYVAGAVNIAQIDLNKRDRSREHVFALRPGLGLHQPQNAPHWVETGTARSISYSFVFETDVSRATGRVRAYNRYLRRLGLSPTGPGVHPSLDMLKERTMRVVTPLRNGARETLQKAFRKSG